MFFYLRKLEKPFKWRNSEPVNIGRIKADKIKAKEINLARIKTKKSEEVFKIIKQTFLTLK